MFKNMFIYGCQDHNHTRRYLQNAPLDKLKELRGSVEFRNKETLLKELSDKRREIRY